MKNFLSVLSSTLQGGVRGGLLLLALFANMSAIYASDTQVDDIWYDFDSSTKTASVTYRGSEYNSYSNEYFGSVIIPETVTYDGTTYSVTSIGKYAFYDCSSLVSVTIPNSVTHIGDHAFYKTSSLTSVNIPNSVTSIGDYAFRGCSSLTAIDIPNSLTKIVHGMFDDCSSLATVTIPNSVTSIDTWAFSSCTSLTSITIPNSVTRIGSFAFEYCRSLTAITIPESVTDIGSGAFESCSSLTSVVWNAKKCGQAYNYDGYTHFEIELMDSTNYSYEEIGEFVKYFLDEGNIINNSPFHDCDGIKSFSFGENVEFIPDGLCYGLDGITSITIPESVSSIGERSFGECSSLDTIYCYSKNLPIMYLTELHVHIVNIEMVYTYDEATPYIYDNTILYVPCQLLDAYKSQEEYTIRFPNIQCLEDTPPSEPQDTTIYLPTEYATICEGTTFVWMGMEFTEAGTYTHEEIAEDENYIYHYIHTLELQVIVPPLPDTIVVEAYDSYEWHGVVYTESGTYIYEEHCYQEILQLTIIDTPTPPEPEIPTKGIGVFSIGEGKTVTFSRGNLQYTQSTNTWSFASAQWEMIGTDNVTGGSVSSNLTYGDSKSGNALADKIDLFGWSTSATNFGVSTSKSTIDYSGSFVDWGTNQIGTDAPNTWRTLTGDEWYYLRYTRTNADALCGVAQVNGVNGLVFLPDNWTCPEGATLKSGFHSDDSKEAYGQYQTFTSEQWSKLEAAGAVFLSASGTRSGSNVHGVQRFGSYWSANEHNGDYARCLYFYSDEAGWGGFYRYAGRSVRLVKDVNSTTPEPPVEPQDTTIYLPTVYETICEGEMYTWMGVDFTAAGMFISEEIVEDENYIYHYIYTLELQVLPSSIDTIVVETYDSYEWHGKVYTESGTYIYEEHCYQEILQLTIIDTPTPPEPEIPTEGIGVFSIGEGKTVTFSPGNLQYHPANNEWRFAENQTDYIGEANSNISSIYNGWLDLFGWSTSATNFGVSTSTDYDNYSGSFVDWGTNKIGNDAPNTWRTLTYDEWDYLRYNRTNANDLCGVAQVNGVNGLIFLPDNWTCPAGVAFKSGFNSRYGVDFYAAYQTFTAEQWSKMESAGAIFLPAAGDRGGSDVDYVQNYGTYWSATKYSYGAYSLYFFSDGAYVGYGNRDYGLSVRLVKDINGTTPEPPVEPEIEEIFIYQPVDSVTICASELPYIWTESGMGYTEAGTYTYEEIVEEEDYIYHNIYILELTVLPSETKEFFHNVMVCSNELPYYWWVNGEYGQYEVRCEKEGIYQHFENQECSENIYTLHLTVLPSETIETEVEAYDSYEWHGEVYTESGTYFYEDYCYQEILHLTIIPSPGTAVDNMQTDSDHSAQKILRDQQILILRDGKTYTIMGQEI